MPNAKGRRRRFGSVRKLPSGRFQARYRGPDGLMRTADNTFATQTDANRWLVKQEAKILDGDWRNPDVNMTFGAYAEAWFKDRDYAATTRERNVGILNLHIMPTFLAVPLHEITTPQVRRWRTGLLDAGVGPATVAKAYTILRTILNTAVDDGLIQRNPCRVKGAGTADHAERPFLSVPEVYRLADAVPSHCRALVLMAAFCALRFGELAALERRDIDLEARTVSVRRSYSETRAHGLTVKAPKSAAGVRTVAIPASLVEELAHHLAEYSGAGRTGLVFLGARGGVLRRNNLRRIWLRALDSTGLDGVRFHDLRHTGNTLAATGSATTRELMHRMGHSSVRAALIYQHIVNGRDHQIADYVDGQIRRVERPPRGSSGT
ncbi:site-specific recombinase XerD [Streptomyces sp. 3212.3]|uniref:tyrosine-type recombinase/integrase n=1 Tax=Streptomyces sp. 3212.3 TaxID=1938846 RepID=UPI000E2344B2|nr:site-specific integrase [Streptomyces sp. 3212.3]REE60483.1 site-specific recombinase XerD [Streptomyces sp. 3212.3]